MRNVSWRIGIGVLCGAAALGGGGVPVGAQTLDDEVGESISYDDPVLDRARQQLKGSPLSRQGIRPVRLTLEQCVRLSLQHNAKVRAGDYGVAAAEEQLNEAYAGGWPIFEYEAQTAPVPRNVNEAVRSMVTGNLSWHTRGKIGMGVPIYSFGKLKIAKELGEQGVAGAREQQAQEQVGAVAKVRQLYYGIQLAEEIGRILNDAIGQITEKVNEPRDPEAGLEEVSSKISPIEVLRLRAIRADLERRLSETRMREEVAVEALRVQLGLSPGTAVTVASTHLQPVRHRLEPLAVYQQAALAKRPEALLVDVGVQAKRLQYELERRKALPDVGIGGFFEVGRTLPEARGVTTTDDFTNPFHYTRAGLGVQVKGKFDPHGYRARVGKAKQEYFKSSVEQGIAKEGIQLEVREVYVKAQYAKVQMRRAEEAATVARRMLFLAKSNLDLGVGEKQEFADALQLAFLTQSQYYEAVFNYNTALAELDQKVGLVPAIHDEPQ